MRIAPALLAFAFLPPFLASQTPQDAGHSDPVRIQVDLTTRLGPYTPIYAWFGYDEANYTTMPHGRQLLGELHDLSPSPVFIRAHHLLTSGNGVAELKFSSTNLYSEDPSGNPVYDFKIIDSLFDTWLAAGVRPMVELGFMPHDLAASLPDRPGQPYQVHYPANTVSGASNNPPKDYAKWQELCRVLTAHLVQRYGREQVLQWYFEVWNEPDIDYWHSTPQDYFRLYDYAVAGVRAALPEARVGGPATTSPRSDKAAAFLRSFLEHVQSGQSAATHGPIPLDFISFHAKGSPTIPPHPTPATAVTMGINKELTDVDRGFALIASFPRFQHLPIILSEADPEGCAACSSRVNPANNYRNGTLYPAYTAAVFKALYDLQDRHAVNLISMLSWSFEFEDKDYFEGFRSLATNGIDKPILNLFRMLGLLSGDRVRTASTAAVPLDTLLGTGVRQAPDIDAFATVSTRSAAVLLWNYHDVNQPAPAAPVNISMQGIPAGVHRVLVQHFRIDDRHSNAYTTWQQMGSPQHPSDDQLTQLHAAAQLQPLTSPQWLEVKDGTIAIPTDLPRQSVSLIRLQWE